VFVLAWESLIPLSLSLLYWSSLQVCHSDGKDWLSFLRATWFLHGSRFGICLRSCYHSLMDFALGFALGMSLSLDMSVDLSTQLHLCRTGVSSGFYFSS
jgi:hypothetical protein